MSAEETVSEGLEAPMAHNAQAAEEAKRMLAELEAEAGSADNIGKTNGVEKDDTAAEEPPKYPQSSPTGKEVPKPESGDAEDEARERRQDRDRRDNGGRGRGRGRDGGRGRGRGDRKDYNSRSHRDNIKSDLTTQEITDDPEAIRAQVF